jgi:hypothetical protein
MIKSSKYSSFSQESWKWNPRNVVSDLKKMEIKEIKFKFLI